jgi:hypothetical protein
MKQECGDIRRLLDSWIDGELSGSELRRMTRHLEGCSDCREEAESRREVDAALSAENKANDPGDAYFASLDDRLSARFDFANASQQWAKPEDPPQWHRRAVPRAWVRRFAFGVAGVAVATIAGILVHDMGKQPYLPPSRPGSTLEASRGGSGVPTVQTIEKSRVATPPSPPAESPKPETPKPETPKPETPKPETPGTPPAPLPDLLPVPATRQSHAGSARSRFADKISGTTPATRSSEAKALRTREDVVSADALAEAAAPSRPMLLAFFRGLLAGQDDRLVASPTGAATTLAQKAAEIPARSSNSTLPRAAPAPANSPSDSTWIRQHLDYARARADSALATGTLEDCESALRAYWEALHPGGALPRDSAANARVLEPDRARIASLLSCASR